MKKFTVCFEITGGVTIEAETEEQAKELFYNYNIDQHANMAEVTQIFEDTSEDDDDIMPWDEWEVDTHENSQNANPYRPRRLG